MDATPQSARDSTHRLVLIAVGGVGMASVMTQLALLRELLNAFSGNELVFGIGLGTWLLLTGIGAGLGQWAERMLRRRAPQKSELPDPEPVLTGLWISGLVLAALIPLAQVVAARVLRDTVFYRGADVGLADTILGSTALLLPFCIVSGMLFTLACSLISNRGQTGNVGRVYVADTLGSIAGGIAFSFLLVPHFDHFALLCFPAAANLLLAGALAWRCRKPLLLASIAIVAAGLAAHVVLIDTDAITTAVQNRGLSVFRASSPYGRLIVTDDSGQLTFYENGVPVAATHSIELAEETAHYAMSQRPNARHVLLLSGLANGAAREILRYRSVAEVVCVELDPEIVEAVRRFLPENLNDARLTIVNADGRNFVRRTDARYDVIIAAAPDPSTAAINRFYTAEFFAEAKRALTPGGVLAFGISHYENYVSPELTRLLATARHTVQTAFANTLALPGGRVFFLASDGPLHRDIADRIVRSGVPTRFVNRYYLDAALAPDRCADIERAVAQPAEPNTDFHPRLYYLQLQHWLSQFSSHSGLLSVLLLLPLAVYLWRLHAVPRALFASGFAASTLEVVLLLAHQTLYGSLYFQVGLVVTAFMAGLAAGAWRAQRNHASSRRQLACLGIALAALALALPVLLHLLAHLNAMLGAQWIGQCVVLPVTFLLAALVGAQFPLAGGLETGKTTATAARLYAADLVGAALGALLASAWLIPVFGLTTTCWIAAGLNLATANALVGLRPSRA